MVVRISDKMRYYSKVTKLLVKPFFFVIHVFSPLCILSYLMCAKSKQMKVHTQIHKYFKVYKNIASEGKKITHQ